MHHAWIHVLPYHSEETKRNACKNNPPLRLSHYPDLDLGRICTDLHASMHHGLARQSAGRPNLEPHLRRQDTTVTHEMPRHLRRQGR